MTRYDETYRILATRAVKQSGVDFDTFVEIAAARGISAQELERMLIQDLDNDGPVFGKFLRSINAAAGAAVQTAARQGAMVAAVESDREAQRELEGFLKLADAADAQELVSSGDPDALEVIEDLAADIPMMWVATLVKTCHLCLPLHGKIDTKRNWDARGLSPDNIHQNEGWDAASKCQCSLVPNATHRQGKQEIAPLLRTKLQPPEGKKTSRRTVRAVAQQDYDKAREAVRKAMETEQGRRTLRLLGQIHQEDADG